MKDTESTDERIQGRIDYLEAFCRNIIRDELEKYKVSVYRRSVIITPFL
jgi:hypothetical protein